MDRTWRPTVTQLNYYKYYHIHAPYPQVIHLSTILLCWIALQPSSIINIAYKSFCKLDHEPWFSHIEEFKVLLISIYTSSMSVVHTPLFTPPYTLEQIAWRERIRNSFRGMFWRKTWYGINQWNSWRISQKIPRIHRKYLAIMCGPWSVTLLCGILEIR